MNWKHNPILGVVLGAVVLVGTFALLRIHPVTSLHDQLLAIENGIPTGTGKQDFEKQSVGLTKSVDPELVNLDSQISTCDADVSDITSSGTFGGSCVSTMSGTVSSTTPLVLGGQCCSADMDTEDYHANLQKLQAYKGMPDIPLDPMHTPVAMAQMWIAYDHATTLTPAQQAIYDQAYAMSKEKPCCCKCWHYFTNEGIAKKMIVGNKFDAGQIAAFWDASDICGA